jgi:hypothetical protein
VVQVFAGALIGSQVLRSNIAQLKKIIVPTAMLIVGMLVMNVAAGFLLTCFGGLDASTALFASAPGGMSDMAIIAADMGADTVAVALMQLLRVIAVYISFPQLIARMLAKRRAQTAPIESAAMASPEPASLTSEKPKAVIPLRTKASGFAVTMVSATVGAVLATMAGVPAGQMVGALFAVAISNVAFNKGFFFGQLRPYIQILAGAYIGSQMSSSTFATMISLLVPTVILVACLVGFSIGLAFLVHRFTKLDFGICLLGCAPAGIQEMALLADDLGVDSTKVAIMHTFRLSTVIAFFPTLLGAISCWL